MDPEKSLFKAKKEPFKHPQSQKHFFVGCHTMSVEVRLRQKFDVEISFADGQYYIRYRLSTKNFDGKSSYKAHAV